MRDTDPGDPLRARNPFHRQWNVNYTLQCAVERRVFLVGAKPTQQRSLRLVASRAVHGGNEMG